MLSLFRTFGPTMKSFGMRLDSITTRHTPRLMELINLCCHETMTDLALDNVALTADVILILQPLLSRLANLELKRCRWGPKTVATKMVSELQSLSIERMANFPFCVAIPKLESFSITQTKIATDFRYFLEKNGQLKEIKIDQTYVLVDLIQSIVQFVPKIEKISYRGYQSITANVKGFGQLSALQSLEMGCPFQSFSSILHELVAARIPLKRL